MHAAHKLGSVQGGRGCLEREHWEFFIDSRPTNLTWSWRQVGAKGLVIAKSAAFADLRFAVNDAVGRGFSPGAGNWVVRVPIRARSLARRPAVLRAK